jgi:hypothetical protein
MVNLRQAILAGVDEGTEHAGDMARVYACFEREPKESQNR